ncbi:MAG TPA: acylphosphatase [Casimicrobiaceae bacterium]
MTRSDDWPHRASVATGTDDPLRETKVGGAQVYAGALLDVRRDEVRLPDGAHSVREYIVHPGAVLVVPERDDGTLVVERQFRYPLDRAFLEFPAGKLDAGESALACARRELVEETGWAAVEWTHLGAIHPSIAYSTEAIELYLARGMRHVGARLDAGEFLELVEMSESALLDAQDDGRLTDAKTVAALAHYARWRSAPTRSCRIRITGRVQGVGFRDWITRAAEAVAVTGWVRNRRDGDVEVHVQGARAACDAVIERCRRGPRAAEVELVEVLREPASREVDGFAMLPTQ